MGPLQSRLLEDGPARDSGHRPWRYRSGRTGATRNASRAANRPEPILPHHSDTPPMTTISRALALALPAPAFAQDGDLMALYRDFHANPELSMQEVKTAAKLAAEARKLGFDVTTGVGTRRL